MLKVSWFVPPAIHVLAESRGLLKAYDVEVEGALTGTSDDQYDGLWSGEQDAVVTAMDNVILWNRRGRADDFRIVAQTEATTAISLIVRPGHAVVADLAGARLLVDSAQNGFVIALRMLLADADVSFDDCVVLPVGGVRERHQALLEGRGDATLLGPPFVAMAERAGMLRLADVDRSYPGFPGQGVVARAVLAADRRDELRRWLAALEDARVACRRDPAGAAAELADLGMPLTLASALIGAVGETLLPSREGVALLVAQRRQLALPGGDADPDLLIGSERSFPLTATT